MSGKALPPIHTTCGPAGGENGSATMLEPTLGGAIEPDITTEPEWNPSEQVCDPAVPSIAEALKVWIGAPSTRPSLRVSFWTII